MNKEKKKVILILGATASGKSSLALELKEKNNAEIINVDSRQIYRGLEIFSGLDEREKNNFLVSFLEPEKDFSAGDFTSLAEEKIEEIFQKKDTAILVGGSTFYFKALLYKNSLPAVGRNEKLRKELEGKSLDELLDKLRKADPKRYEKIDRKNKVRIIRSLEIIAALGSVPESEEKIRDD